MQGGRHGLGDAAKKLNLRRPMRSKVSDALVSPPVPEGESGSNMPGASKNDPKAVAEGIWRALLSAGAGPEFDARFHLRGGKIFTLRGDKENFGSIQPSWPSTESNDGIIEAYHQDVVKIDIFMEDSVLTFSSYKDFMEWQETV